MNKTFKLVLFLAIVSAISGFSIGMVNSFTAPKIEANAIEAEKRSLEIIYPGSEFTNIEFEDEEGVVLNVYAVKDKGYVFKGTAKGYNASNPIICLIGLDVDGSITNVVALQHSETSGVGSKCFEQENIDELYIGKQVKEEIDVLSGATFTSNAIKTIINRAQEVYLEIK